MVHINYRDPRPIYEQVKDGFRKLILTGVLQPDERMPSVRELATNLAINPNTIQRAYRELEQEGYICSVPGKGSFVTDASDAAALRRRDLMAHCPQASSLWAGWSKRSREEHPDPPSDRDLPPGCGDNPH